MLIMTAGPCNSLFRELRVDKEEGLFKSIQLTEKSFLGRSFVTDLVNDCCHELHIVFEYQLLMEIVKRRRLWSRRRGFQGDW